MSSMTTAVERYVDDRHIEYFLPSGETDNFGRRTISRGGTVLSIFHDPVRKVFTASTHAQWRWDNGGTRDSYSLAHGPSFSYPDEHVKRYSSKGLEAYASAALTAWLETLEVTK